MNKHEKVNSVDPDLDTAIGARLRAYRQAKDLTQSAIGQSLGVTFQQIQKYENGKNRISGSSIVAICRALNITPNELLGYKSIKGTSDAFSAIAGNSDMVKIILAINNLNIAQQRAAIDIMLGVIRLVGSR